MLRTREGMVDALDEAGLQKLAPMVVGDYFPGQSPKKLARKADVLMDPLEFSLAGHSAAAAYTGHSWKRVDCAGWC